jgi:hypothetical protein
MTSLSDSLTNKNLKNLRIDINFNKIGNNGAKILSDSLSRLSNIKSLIICLYLNKIDSENKSELKEKMLQINKSYKIFI